MVAKCHHLSTIRPLDPLTAVYAGSAQEYAYQQSGVDGGEAHVTLLLTVELFAVDSFGERGLMP